MTAQPAGDTSPRNTTPYVQIEHGSLTYGWWPPCTGDHDHQPDPAVPAGRDADGGDTP